MRGTLIPHHTLKAAFIQSMSAPYAKKRNYARTTSSYKKGDRKVQAVRLVKPKRKATKYAKLLKTITTRKPHFPINLENDTDNILLEQSFQCNLSWPTPEQKGTTVNQRTDGFMISMNALLNTFSGQAGSLGSTHNGVPTATSSGTGLGFYATAQSSSGGYNSGSDLHSPNGLLSVMNRFQQLCVISGEFKLRISQETPYPRDTSSAPDAMGTTKIAVCGFPSAPSIGEVMQSFGNGHWIYPYSSSLPTDQKDFASFQALCTEPNCIVKDITETQGSKTIAQITYPFTMAKYSPPGYWTSSAFYQHRYDNISGNPTYAFQPRILVQMLTGGELDLQVYKLELSMKWKLKAFERQLIATSL